MPVRVQLDVLHAYTGPGRLDLREGREPAFAPEESPASAQRSRRDVEGAAGRRVQPAGKPEELEQFRFGAHGSVPCRPVDPHERARVAEHRQQRLEPVGLVQRGARHRHVGGVAIPEHDLEPAGHGGPVHANPVVCSRGEAVAVPLHFEGEQLPAADRHDGFDGMALRRRLSSRFLLRGYLRSSALICGSLWLPSVWRRGFASSSGMPRGSIGRPDA